MIDYAIRTEVVDSATVVDGRVYRDNNSARVIDGTRVEDEVKILDMDVTSRVVVDSTCFTSNIILNS